MSEATGSSAPPRSFWVIGGLALVWNVIGIATYLMTVTMSDEAVAALPEAERALQGNVPIWVTSAYAVGVFGGTLGSVGLLLRKAWATPVLVVSLVAIVIQMGYGLLGTALIEVRGGGAAVLPVAIVVIAAYLVWFARDARARGWIR